MTQLLEKNILDTHNSKKIDKITININHNRIKNNIINPNIYFDKIFIINLIKSKDRWEKIKLNLIENGIYNFERQNGIYLPRFNPFQKLNPLLYKNLEAYGGAYTNSPTYILNAVGTNLAHYEILKKAQKRNYQRILILEDDVFINKLFYNKFYKNIKLLDKIGWDMIYFGFKKSTPNLYAKQINRDLIRPICKIRGAYGYALNKSIIPFLLKNYLYRGTEIDVFFEFVVLKKKRVYAFYPCIISHRDKLVSTITNTNWKSRK